MKNNEQGRSMIEMLGVLAIIGVLSVGGIAGYSKAMAKYRTNKTIEQATMLITNIRTLYAQQQNFEGLNNSRAVNLELVPEEMIVDAGTKYDDDANTSRRLRNIFSGDVQIKPSPIDSKEAECSVEGKDTTKHCGAFKVTFYGLSRDACLQVATSDWGAGISSGLIGLHIFSEDSTSATSTDTGIDKLYKEGYNGDTYDGQLKAGDSYAYPSGEKYRVPFTVVQAQTACNCRGTNTCAISWKYF